MAVITCKQLGKALTQYRHKEILTVACRSSVFPIRSSNLSPLSSTLLMLSFRMILTSLTWPCTWSSLAEPGAGVCGFDSACEKRGQNPWGPQQNSNVVYNDLCGRSESSLPITRKTGKERHHFTVVCVIVTWRALAPWILSKPGIKT